jgi:predicted DNA-binding transcriptional regulator YafY
MTQRSDSQDTVRLTIEILRRIPRSHFTNAPELHAQLASIGIHRDLRSIQRQLETLSTHYEIIRDERTRPYGYKWMKDAKGLSLPGLDEQESLFLLLAEQHLKNLLPPNTMKSMQGFFEQARSNLCQSVTTTQGKKLAKEWLNKVSVISSSQPLLPPRIAKGVLEAVSKTLYNNQYLDIEYTNANGDTYPARVMPLGLAQQDHCLYLACRFDGYDNERTLALHRITTATPCDLHFKRPKDFDLTQYEQDGRFCFGNGVMTRLTFRIYQDAGRHLLESRLSTDQTHRIIGNKYEITATVIDSPRLTWWLNSFGKAVSHIKKEPLEQPDIQV